MTVDNQFIEAHAYIVQTIVKQYHYLHIEDDLMQEGYLGLVEAGRKYDPACGVLFESYAAWWVRKYVKDAIRLYGFIVSMPAHPKEEFLQKARIQLDKPLYDEDGDVVTLADTIADDTNLDEPMDKEKITKEVLAILTPRELAIIGCYYGIDRKQLPVDEIAKEFGLKRKNVYHILERAMEKLQKKSKKYT